MTRFQAVAPEGARLADLRPDLASMVVRNLTKPDVDPRMVSIASHMRVLWRCECGEEFEAFVSEAAKRDRFSCRLCRYGVDDPRLLEEFVRNLTQPDVPLSRCVRSSQDLCLWKCRDCGSEWEQIITNRASRRRWNCPHCAKQRGAATRQASQPDRSEVYWAERFRLLEAYAKKTGSANVPNDHVEGEIQLGRWVQSQRDHRDRLNLSQIQRLENLPGWSWQRTDRGLLKLADARPDLAAQWHPELNDRSPRDVSVGSSYRAAWQGCPVDPRHRWTSQVRWRVKSPLIENPCLICAGWQVMKGVSDLATTHPDLAAQWHPELNDRGPDSVGYGSAYKAWWTNCPEDSRHVWQAAVENRTKGGTNCTVCLGKTVMEGINDLATLEPDIAAQWHPELNRKPPTAYSRQSNAVVYWRCERGHVWKTAISSRQKSGCGVCSNRKLLIGYNDLLTLRPEIAEEWDIAGNEKGPHEVLVGSHYRAAWICSHGHPWKIAVVARTSSRGSGCPVCAWRKTSPEIALQAALDEHTPSIVLSSAATLLDLRWKRSNVRMKVDIAGVLASDHSFPVAVEYDGSYYHYDAVNVARDVEKTTALLEAGYVVIRIREQANSHKLADLPLRHPRLFQLPHRLQHKNATKPKDFTHLAAEIHTWIQSATANFIAQRHEPVSAVFVEHVEKPVEPTQPRMPRHGLGTSGRTAAWNTAFATLQAYAASNGSALVPQRYVTEDGFWLGSWVKRQRGKESDLSPEQRDLLEALPGWKWNVPLRAMVDDGMQGRSDKALDVPLPFEWGIA